MTPCSPKRQCAGSRANWSRPGKSGERGISRNAAEISRWLATGKADRSGSDTRLGNDGDDPPLWVAGLGFHDRMDQPRDERSLNRQGCLLATMLVVAAASRDFWIGRLERFHVDQAAGNETVPRASAGSS